MMYSKIFAILTLAAARLPTAFAEYKHCTIGCAFEIDGQWHYVTQTGNIGDTIHINDHSTVIGRDCKPNQIEWSNAMIYSWGKTPPPPPPPETKQKKKQKSQ